MDPELPFQVRTARNPVYIERKQLSFEHNTCDIDFIQTGPTQQSKINNIMTKDHFFDTVDRTRAKPRHVPKGVSNWLQPAKGVRGVREHHKVDESQISLLARMNESENI